LSPSSARGSTTCCSPPLSFSRQRCRSHRAPPGGGWFQNFGADRICLGRTVFPLTDAITWYEALKRGQGVVPGKNFPVTSARLAPEPDDGFTVLSEPPPFSPARHGRPGCTIWCRWRRWPSRSRHFETAATEVEAFIRAREWLRQHVNFDLLAHDDWLGSAVLILRVLAAALSWNVKARLTAVPVLRTTHCSVASTL